MWRVGIAWSPSYVVETSQARLPFRCPCGLFTAFPKTLTIPIILRARRDRTRRPCKQIVIWQPYTSGGRGDELVFQLPVAAHDSLLLLVAWANQAADQG